MPKKERIPDPRKHDRVHLKMDVEIILGEKILTGKVRDISAGGMYIESPEPLPDGSHPKVRFTLDSEAEAIEVEGKVAWTNEGKDRIIPTHSKGMGVQFVENDQSKRIVLVQFVRDLNDLLKIMAFTSKRRDI